MEVKFWGIDIAFQLKKMAEINKKKIINGILNNKKI